MVGDDPLKAPREPQVRGMMWDEDRSVGCHGKMGGLQAGEDERLEIGICSSWA